MNGENTYNELPKWVKVLTAGWLHISAVAQIAVIIIGRDVLDLTVVFGARVIFICIGVFVLYKIMFSVGRIVSQVLLNKGGSAVHLNHLLAREILLLFALNDSSKLLKLFYYGSIATYSIASVATLITI